MSTFDKKSFKMGRSDLLGSWYNSGYHGHFRSKARLDFINEYRNIARPLPPQVFAHRTQETMKHPFSHHDNKHSFQSDALYFEQGLGRRRFKNKQTKWDPCLLSWMPLKQEWSRAGPTNTLYKTTFRGIPAQQIKQKLVSRPKTSFDLESPTTTYRYVHGADNPHRINLTINASCNDGLQQPTVLNRKQKSTLVEGRESVASCMTWYTPRPPSAGPKRHASGRPNVPAATQIVPPKSQTAPANIQTGEGTLDIVGDIVPRVTVGSPISTVTAPADLAGE